VLRSLLSYLLLHQLHRVLIGHPFHTERSQAVTLTEVKDALFRDYVQGDNRSYASTCQLHVSLSLLIVTAWSVCNYH